MSQELSPQYEPKSVEDRWIPAWLESGINAPAKTSTNPDDNYCIVIPPPNVTGSLHMGHALNNTIQDILCRYQRMRGKNVLWVVGTDHAGIATQNVVEKQLAAEGKKRDDLGRAAFIERVWKWKAESGGTIINQLKRLGSSCDFDGERFTMDEGLSAAVKKVFVKLHEQGLIYRGKRLINWCPRCQSALSDLEVEHETKKGSLWHIKYPLSGKTDEFLIVATTRPETLFGDVAVAVHPEDERYKSLIGKTVELPLTGRQIPIIADTFVDKDFGSGVVKITPAHDFNDFAAGERHKLERINIFTPDAKLNEETGTYAGLDRFKARDKVLLDLEALTLLDKTDEHQNNIGHCYRCKTVVEPYLSNQWFVSTKPLAAKAMDAVRSGKTRFVPEHWNKTYFQWMENIQDWCISRQIWWGHQIPAWYCEADTQCPIIVSESTPTKCPTCSGTKLTQDQDVLDTWFSSGLWPFSTLGWPEQTERLKAFYPTSALVTAFDIIFFWVARMMMFGCHLMDEVPFKDVYIHALVRDPTGAKMSKSKGNVVDPLIMMHKYGTDAFRFTLAFLASQGRDIKLDEQRIETSKFFCNKIWNATRFGQMMAGEFRKPGYDPLKASTPVNRWILEKLAECSRTVPQKIESYEFNVAAQNLYRFFWNQFCDWYIELIKPIFKDGTAEEKTETANTFFYVLDAAMRLLHPFMPFITEEIWQIVQGKNAPKAREDFLMSQDYPINLSFGTHSVDAARVDTLIEVISAVRSIRQDTGLKVSVALKVILNAPEAERLAITSLESSLKAMAKVDALSFTDKDPTEAAALAIAGKTSVFVPLAGLIDVSAEQQRLDKKRDKLSKAIEGLQTRLGDEKFTANAPEELLAETRTLLASQQSELALIERGLKLLFGKIN
jgi:valyl-tRNA synthetase